MVRLPRTTWLFAGPLLLVVFLISWRAHAYKECIAAAVSRSLGMRVTIEGPLELAFDGDVIIRMDDLHVRDAGGADFMRTERATVALAPVPLLFRRYRIHRIILKRPLFAIVRGANGSLNWGRRAGPRGASPALAHASVTVRDGRITYHDCASGATFEATGVDLAARGVEQGEPDS